MRKEKKAALDVLAKASEVYNDWAILDDAVTCGEDDGFTREYIKCEREVLADAITDAMEALKNLGKLYDISVIVSCVYALDWEAK